MLGAKKCAGNRIGAKRGAKIDLLGAKMSAPKPPAAGEQPAEKKARLEK
jgi:hypothetical protein